MSGAQARREILSNSSPEVFHHDLVRGDHNFGHTGRYEPFAEVELPSRCVVRHLGCRVHVNIGAFLVEFLQAHDKSAGSNGSVDNLVRVRNRLELC